jgi:hypothetical protein
MLERQERRRIRIRWQAAREPAAPAGPVPASATATVTGGGSATIVARAPAPRAQGTGQTGTRGGAGGQTRPTPFFVREVGNVEPDVPRLRRLAVPGLVAANVTNYQVGAGGPIADIAGVLGLGGSASTAVTIRLRELASLAVDEQIADTFLDGYRRRWIEQNLHPARLLRSVARIDGRTAELLCRGDAQQVERRGMALALANAVIYAGRIDYEFSRSTTAALLGGANLVNVLAQVSPATVPTVPAAVPAAAPGAVDAGALMAQLRATQEALAQSLPTSAGARVSLGVGAFGGLSLNEIYPVPVAVGFGAPIYYELAASLIPAGANVGAADAALLGGLRFCATVLGVAWEAAHSAANPPGDLRAVRDLMCGNAREDQARELARPSQDDRREPQVAVAVPAACGESDRRLPVAAGIEAPPPTPRRASVAPAEFLQRGR